MGEVCFSGIREGRTPLFDVMKRSIPEIKWKARTTFYDKILRGG